MNAYTSAGLPARLSRPLLRSAAGVALVGSLLALTSGCVVAVRPAPATVYAAPPPPPPAVYAEPSEVVVDVAPPAPIVETVGVAPGPGFFWIGGYYHWYGNHWGWVGGHYERPPHPGARWIGPRYAYRGGHRVYVRGYWH